MERLEEGLAQERRLTTQLETLMSLTLLPQGNVSEAVIAGALLERIMGALEANIGFVVHETDDRFQVIAGRRAGRDERDGRDPAGGLVRFLAPSEQGSKRRGVPGDVR